MARDRRPLMQRPFALFPDGVPHQNPPRDSRSACPFGLEWSTDGTSWRFDTVDERRQFVLDALIHARHVGAATSVIHTLRQTH